MPGTANHILGCVQLQQRLQFRQSESVLLNEPFGPTTDDGVEVNLYFQQHSKRYGMPVHWSQRTEQVSMATAVGDIYGTLTAGVLVGPPSTGIDQLPDHVHRSPVPGSLVERSVPSGSAKSAGVDPLWVAGQQLQDTSPVATLGCVGQRMAHSRCFVGQRSGLGDSVPDDVHVESPPDATPYAPFHGKPNTNRLFPPLGRSSGVSPDRREPVLATTYWRPSTA